MQLIRKYSNRCKFNCNSEAKPFKKAHQQGSVAPAHIIKSVNRSSGIAGADEFWAARVEPLIWPECINIVPQMNLIYCSLKGIPGEGPYGFKDPWNGFWTYFGYCGALMSKLVRHSHSTHYFLRQAEKAGRKLSSFRGLRTLHLSHLANVKRTWPHNAISSYWSPLSFTTEKTVTRRAQGHSSC